MCIGNDVYEWTTLYCTGPKVRSITIPKYNLELLGQTSIQI